MEHRYALVTAGAQGLGRAIVQHLPSRGIASLSTITPVMRLP